jgi:hypothetical protein
MTYSQRVIAFLAFLSIVAISGVVTAHIQSREQGERIERIEKEVKYPCTKGVDTDCRRFLDILLKNATKEQLRRLLRAKELNPSEEELGEFFRRIDRKDRKFNSNVFGPLRSLSPAPQVEGVMPGGGNKSPGGQ